MSAEATSSDGRSQLWLYLAVAIVGMGLGQIWRGQHMTEAAVERSSRVLNNQLLLEQSSTRGLLSRFDTYPDRNAARDDQ